MKWWHTAPDGPRSPATEPGIAPTMADPYRDPDLRCPACPEAQLRPFRGRLVCDACGGIQMPLSDLAEAIHDLTGIEPTLALVDEQHGKRACPHCRVAMTTCRVTVRIEDDLVKTRPTLDHCVEHGIWFDNEELALVLAKVRRKRPRDDGGRSGPDTGGIPLISFGGRGSWP